MWLICCNLRLYALHRDSFSPAPIHAIDEWVFKENREPCPRGSTAFCLLQLRKDSFDVEDNAAHDRADVTDRFSEIEDLLELLD
jgi:hypothetical protein